MMSRYNKRFLEQCILFLFTTTLIVFRQAASHTKPRVLLLCFLVENYVTPIGFFLSSSSSSFMRLIHLLSGVLYIQGCTTASLG